jgi:nitrate reductase NapAB chaperone NapD
MIYSGSIIQVKEDGLEAVKELLDYYPQVDLYSVSEDKQQLVVAIEEESSNSLEDLCAKLKECDDILDIGHVNFFFEDEVERMLKDGETIPMDQLLKNAKDKQE